MKGKYKGFIGIEVIRPGTPFLQMQAI